MPEVTLELLYRHMQQGFNEVNTRLDAVESRLALLQGMLTRLDSADTGITAELRGVREVVMTHEQRISRLEAAAGQ